MNSITLAVCSVFLLMINCHAQTVNAKQQDSLQSSEKTALEQLRDMKAELKKPYSSADDILKPLNSWAKDALFLALREPEDDPLKRMRWTAVRLLVEKFADELTLPEAGEIAEQFKHSHYGINKVIAEGLGKNERLSEQIFGPLLDSNNEKEAVWSAIGIRQARKHADEVLTSKALQSLLKRLGNESGPDFPALNYLANIQIPEITDWLIEKVFSENASEWLKVEASMVLVHQLRDIKDGKAVLLRMLQSTSSNVRHEGLVALRDHLDATTIATVREFAHDKSGENRRWVFICLSEFPMKESLPTLIHGLEDVNEDVVSSAIQGISKLKAKEAIPALVAVLKRSRDSGKEMTRNEIAAGACLALLTEQKFNFDDSLICGYDAGYSLEIEAAKVGGEKGAELMKQVKKVSGEASMRRAARIENIANSNLLERNRMLDWWTAQRATK